jgi:hypothetical protein
MEKFRSAVTWVIMNGGSESVCNKAQVTNLNLNSDFAREGGTTRKE